MKYIEIFTFFSRAADLQYRQEVGKLLHKEEVGVDTFINLPGENQIFIMKNNSQLKIYTVTTLHGDQSAHKQRPKVQTIITIIMKKVIIYTLTKTPMPCRKLVT